MWYVRELRSGHYKWKQYQLVGLFLCQVLPVLVLDKILSLHNQFLCLGKLVFPYVYCQIRLYFIKPKSVVLQLIPSELMYCCQGSDSTQTEKRVCPPPRDYFFETQFNNWANIFYFEGWRSGASSHRIMGAFRANTVWFVRQSGGGSGYFPHHRRMRHVLYQRLWLLWINTWKYLSSEVRKYKKHKRK